MSALSLRQAGYAYPAGAGVGPVSLEVEAGEIVLLAGPTGSGKSTLARLAAGLVQRHGKGAPRGEVRVVGVEPHTASPGELVGLVGFVAQEAGDQIVASTLGEEIGLALARWEPGARAARVAEVLREVGLPEEPGRGTGALSLGQQQRLVLGAAIAPRPAVLILDEPLSQVDPAGAEALVALLRRIAGAGTAVLWVEHRLDRALAGADRVVLLDQGAIRWEGPCQEAPLPLLRELGLELPALRALDEGLAAAGLAAGGLAARWRGWRPPLAPLGAVLREEEGLRWSWGPGTALEVQALSLRAGERVALLGGNGAGKSTLLRLLAGELGRGRPHARTQSVPQEPDLTLFCATVGEELAYGPREARRRDALDRVRVVSEALGLLPLAHRPPPSLSRGQRQRVAVGAALTCTPTVLLLDEPTSGQDLAGVERILDALEGALSDGALLFATHDVDLALRRATRLLLLDRGRLVWEGTPAQALAAPPSGLRLPPLAERCRAWGLPYLEPAALLRGQP
ncbi:MAG: ATP-binding cassette domain-containing protein [Deltaproteobacteria bacterium]|nr:ATP-binding cassette domain-containing protein [Deltaproteobacteria bacterium]